MHHSPGKNLAITDSVSGCMFMKFKCVSCTNSTISIWQKWKSSKTKPAICLDCGAKQHLDPRFQFIINFIEIIFISFVGAIVLLVEKWWLATLFLVVIILIEILRALIFPLREGRSGPQ